MANHFISNNKNKSEMEDISQQFSPKIDFKIIYSNAHNFFLYF
jgi:hypothetical protein